MATVKLTKRIVQRAKSPKAGVLFLWDTDKLPDGQGSLGLRLSATGSRTWCVQASPVGSRQPLRRSLGDAREMDLDTARLEAVRVAAALRSGAAAEVAKRRPVKTIGALLDRFIREHGSDVRPSTLEMYHLARRNLTRHLPPGTRLEALTPAVLYEVYREIGADRPTTANHLRAVVSKAWKWAQSAPVGAIPSNLPNPAASLGKKFQSSKRGKVWSRSELAVIGEALAAMPEGVAKVATIVRILTGWRGEEVLSLKWADLGEGGVTTLERAKTGDRLAMLPSLAERFLRTLPACSEYVFPTTHGKSPHLTRNGLNQAWRREIAAPSGLEGQAAMPGNSRKTFTSLGPGLGIDADMMRLLTGHKVQGSHGDYLRLIEDHRVHADRIAAELAARLNLFPEGAAVVSSPVGR